MEVSQRKKFNLVIVVFTVMSACLCGSLGWASRIASDIYPIMDKDGHRCRLVEQETAKANRRVNMDDENRILMGVSLPDHSITKEEAREIYSKDPVKDFVVVRIWNGWGPDQSAERKSMIKRVDEYFHQIGYKRVLILRGQEFGTIMLSDTRAPETVK